MKSYLETLALAAVAVFAPVKAVLVTVLVLVLLDLVLGLLAARKRGEAITSAKLKHTPTKLLVYEAAIAISFLVHQNLTGDMIPIDKIVGGLIGITELKSLMESLQTISGDNIFKILVDKLTATEARQEASRGPEDRK